MKQDDAFLAFQELAFTGMALNATKRKKRRNRTKEWRRLGIVTGLGTFAWLWLTACASVPVEGSYPIAVYIHNGRSNEVVAPHFYLVGVGKHPLGMVGSLDEGTSSIDSRWIPPDGLLRAVVHYAGAPDVVSEAFPWHPGEIIDIRLNQGGQTIVAWSHR